jgi:hypothetical protein
LERLVESMKIRARKDLAVVTGVGWEETAMELFSYQDREFLFVGCDPLELSWSLQLSILAKLCVCVVGVGEGDQIF